MAKKKLVFVNDAEEDGKQSPALVSPKKMKLGACSSPCASDFIVMPAAKKKSSSSKIFSDEDEIALLKGLALFWENGRNNKWAEFYQFIKDDLTNQFSKIQVSEKVRHLKMKFERGRGSDSHEVFRLCKALWGDDDDDDGILKKKRKEGKKGILEKEEEFQCAFPLFYSSFDTFKCGEIIKEKCNLIPREKAQEVEDKCRELQAEALGLELRRIDLIKRDLQHHIRSIGLDAGSSL